MFNPPTEDNWHKTGKCSEYFTKAYELGYLDASKGFTFTYPYKHSNHERDTTFEDECNFWYYSGYYDWED